MIHVSGPHRVVGVPAQPQLTNLFPQARVVDFAGVPTILLPHGLQETVMLRNMGMDVPAPILSQYDWPGDKRPFHVQKLTAALFTTAQRCYCLNGMGTGKTKAALWAFDYLSGLAMATKALVVAPLSTLDHVWRKEVLRTLPGRSVGVLYGDRAKRLKVLAQDHDIYVINTDGLKVIWKELMARAEIDTMIIDELALFRNSNDRNKVACKLAERMVWVWGLTGSPTPNEPTDAWGQCRIITPHTVPKFYTRFRDQLMLKISNFKFVPKRDATEQVFAAMQPAVRFTLDDVTELPPVIERTVDVDLSPMQFKIYEEIRKYAYSAIASKEITAVNAGAVLNKLLQISLGYVYDRHKNVIPLDPKCRLDALVDAVNSTDRKVLCFVPYTHALEGVAERLEKEGIECTTVDGRTPKKQRDRAFTLFQQTSKLRVIAAHPGTMSHGLTLTAADTVIWFGPTTSLETFEQANARVRRIGQQHKQQIIMLQSTPAEKKIYQRLRAKQHVQDNLLALFADNTDSA
jgi:SNF2 family DNA or RNA helicase